ncbi:PAQR family membrane homeostasis protein TrhA [Chitinimonas sp. BJB300]|uniref:PAQR family membrane homeostasis protein TrhA n=1 Tax=Chitinimonas sp. BJB300 TaxID=1559339 RepID=UPI000C0F0655|nr:hemolysin III family protein [Chitinimonas sp. BJB300]PHV10700.1 hemolysin III [Chitinimonas sp. BJB300]TSJ89770.1 hemolysin III family protein [Chitinimonas sp. BJB300]
MYYGERLNSLTHLAGTLFSIAGLVVLVVLASQQGDPWKIVSFSIYGAMLVVLYGFSTLYHSIQHVKAKAVLQKFDHCAIYLLIAGTYTPFALVTLRGGWGWTLFGITWGLALFGIIQELTLGRRTRILSMILYVVMGWMVVIAIKPLIAALPTSGLAWLAIGGIAYSGGIYFFLHDEKVRHYHGIWHLFVLLGSLCQYVSVLFYVA